MPHGNRKTHEQVIGTYNGAAWHRYRRQLPCRACSHAGNVYQFEYDRRGRCEPGLGWPLLPARKDATGFLNQTLLDCKAVVPDREELPRESFQRYPARHRRLS